jgi:hypothetical protein
VLGTKSDIPIFQAELEVQQRHEFFTKYHLDHFSRSPSLDRTAVKNDAVSSTILTRSWYHP